MPGEKHYSEGKVKVPKVKVVWNAQGKARKVIQVECRKWRKAGDEVREVSGSQIL